MPKNLDAEKNNPCLKEQELTYKCFNNNAFDKEKCQMEITNYNTCKSFWNAIKVERKKKGIYPYLPPVEERQQIKQDYFNKFYNQSETTA